MECSVMDWIVGVSGERRSNNRLVRTPGTARHVFIPSVHAHIGRTQSRSVDPKPLRAFLGA